ncbi:MAG: exo-beta-N-acetylmuramidase NamZ domain-containing protein [Runella sp.]
MKSFITYGISLLLTVLSIINLHAQRLTLGCERTDVYLPMLKNKNVGLVVNHTTIFSNGRHLVDSLLSLGVSVKLIFAPEHGFRGNASAGEKIKNDIDSKTGLPIASLYGANRKPNAAQLKDIDVVIFDIQDVGVRYYTYPSTMHYVMEACAENGKKCIVLDRPNPNGHYVAGPVLDRRFASFVGLNPVPIVHGLTSGELAKMINGEGWLAKSQKCDLEVVVCQNYHHQMPYDLPVAPSPNLPNRQSILLYASICLFEGTPISVGRGTDTQFQVIGGTSPSYGSYTFTPEDKPGAINPPNKGKLCYGLDLTKVDAYKEGFTLKYVIEMYRKSPDKSKFFSSPDFFDKLAGTDMIRKQIMEGKSEQEIARGWKADLEKFKTLRKKYLLYP